MITNHPAKVLRSPTGPDSAGISRKDAGRIAMLDSIAASAELERMFLWGERLFGEVPVLAAMSSIRSEHLDSRIPASRASARDLLYHVAETTAFAGVRETALKLLKEGPI